MVSKHEQYGCVHCISASESTCPAIFGPRDYAMAITVYELQGYSIVLNKIAFVTRVFKAEAEEGFQFNIRFDGDLRLAPQFPTRNDADLARELLIQGIKNC